MQEETLISWYVLNSFTYANTPERQGLALLWLVVFVNEAWVTLRVTELFRKGLPDFFMFDIKPRFFYSF